MGCLVCLPSCDKCRPKYLPCPECGGTAYLDLGKCTVCGRPMTGAEREEAVRLWNEKHARDAASEMVGDLTRIAVKGSANQESDA